MKNSRKEKSINVIVRPLENIKNDSAKKQLLKDTQLEFEDFYRGFECEKCKQNSKVNVVIDLNTELVSSILDYQNFCCYDFVHYLRKIPK